jgi:4-amino-4-deoxy-L-arabinose transferase-like glycosyltransferase
MVATPSDELTLRLPYRATPAKSGLSTYILIGILVMAAILRFNHINQPIIDAFSWRQSSTAMMANNFFSTNWNIFLPEVSWGGPGPNYQGREFQTVSYTAALLYNIFGQHDWVGRSVAAVFGVWGVFALYQLADRLWDTRHALLGAAVMAILPGSIFIDRSFLPDPGMVSLVTTSFWLLVEYLQQDQRKYLVLAALVATLGFLSKITGLIAGIPMLYVTFTLLSRKQQLKAKYIIPIAIAAVLMMVPVMAYYLWARHLSLTYPPYHFAGSGNWVWNDGIKYWLSNYYFLPDLIRRWFFNPAGFFLMIVGFLIPPCFSSKKMAVSEDNPEEIPSLKAVWIFHWWLIGGVIYYIIGAKELVNNVWNFHILNPAASVLIAHGMLSLGQLWRERIGRLSKPLVVLMALLIIGMFSQKSLDWMFQSPAQQSHSMGMALRRITQPDDLVVVLGNTMGDPVSIYYSQRRGWTFPPYTHERQDWNRLPEDDAVAIELFEDLRRQGADWFGIVDEQKDFWIQHPRLADHITSTCLFEEKSPDWIIYRIPSV